MSPGVTGASRRQIHSPKGSGCQRLLGVPVPRGLGRLLCPGPVLGGPPRPPPHEATRAIPPQGHPPVPFPPASRGGGEAGRRCPGLPCPPAPPAAGRVNSGRRSQPWPRPLEWVFLPPRPAAASHGSRLPGLTSDGKTIYLWLAGRPGEGKAGGGGHTAADPAARCGGAPPHPSVGFGGGG